MSSAPSSTVWDSFWLRYGLALVFTGLATAFGFVLEDMTGRFSTFPFYAAIVASVWFGTGPGCAAVILSVLAVEDIWTPPLFNLAIADTELPSFAAFVLCTLMTFAWSSQRRNAQRVLEATVRERTADLQKTNDALQVEIRERLAAEEELRRSEALLAQGQKLSRTGSWILRMPAGEMRWSVELYELLGVDPEHDTPSYALLTDRIHREDRPRFTDAIEQALQTGGEFSCDMRLLIPGAEVKFVQVIGETTRRAAAGPSCIGTFIDLTERKRTEEALHKAEAELARTLRLATLAEVAATIAHEINQPLAAITANGSACLRSLTREPPLLDTAREAASCIVSDGHRAGNVIARVRALFEKDEPRRELVDINAIINEVIELSRSAIEREHVIVQTELTPTPVLSADPVQIQQVMVNLVTNALEAMEDVAARPHRLTRGRSAMPTQ